MPTTGQTLFRVAAAELERGVAALADAGRCVLSSICAELSRGIPASERQTEAHTRPGT